MAVKLGIIIEVAGKDQASQVFKDVQNAAEKAGGKVTKTNKDWAGTLTAISVGYLAVKSAMQTVNNIIGGAIKLAAEAQTANNRMAISLKLAGQYTEETYNSLKEYSEQLSSMTGVDNTTITNLMTKNKLFGFSTEQTKALTEASIKLAYVTGVDVEQANKDLQMSIMGNIRGLKQYFPEVVSLTKAQLAQGGAIKLAEEEMNKFGTTGANTYEGALKRLSNAWKQFQESMAEGFLSTDFIDTMIGGLGLLGEAFNTIINWLVKLGIYSELTFNKISLFFLKFGAIRGAFDKDFKASNEQNKKDLESSIQLSQAMLDLVPAAGGGAKKEKAPIGKPAFAGAVEIPRAKDLIQQEAELRQNFNNQRLIIEGELNNSLINEEKVKIAEIMAITEKAYKDNVLLEKDLNQELLKDKIYQTKESEELILAIKKQYALKANEKMAQNITGFLSAAKSGFSSIVTMIGEKFGGIGNLIAGIVNFFGQTTAEFKQMMTQLFDVAMQIPENIFKNIPALVGMVIRKIPDIIADAFQDIGSLIGGILNLVAQIISGVIEMLLKLFTLSFWGKVLTNFWKAIWGGFQNIGNAFTGKAQKDGTEVQNIKKQVSVSFGASKYEEGGAEFKIKDIQLSAERQAKTEFEQSFGEAVEEGGFSLVDKLKEAFAAIWTSLVDKLKEAFAAIWTWLEEKLGGIGGKIWEGFLNAMGDLSELGKKIGRGIVNLVGDIAEFGEKLKELGNDIWRGFISIGPKNIAKLGNWGKQMAEGFLSKMANPVKGWAWNDPKSWKFNSGGWVSQSMSAPAMARAFIAAGALQFAGGGYVPGSGFSDTVPAVLTPGERVLSRSETANYSGGNSVVNFTFNIAQSASIDRDAVKQMMPALIDELRRKSRNGENIIKPSGVY